MKTKNELDTIRQEIVNVSKKLVELTQEELAQVTGGFSGLDEERVYQVGLFLPAKPKNKLPTGSTEREEKLTK